jgi:hypothetical protein
MGHSPITGTRQVDVKSGHLLTHPTLDKLHALKFTGMAVALTEQMQMPDIEELAFEERLGLLVDRELTERENRRLTSRLRRAKLKHNAALEDINYRHPRGLDKSLIHSSARPGSLAHWRKKPAVRGTRPSICACPDSCRTWRSPRVMDAIPSSWPRSPKPRS